jgi:hypothetical protein
MTQEPKNPTANVHARVAEWARVLKDGSEVRDRFQAGRALVEAIVLPNADGELSRGVAALDMRLSHAVDSAQVSEARIDVEVRPDERLGLQAAVKVTGQGDRG